MRIDHIDCREITNTKGRPTLETTLHSGAFTFIASVPSGESTGTHEAVELRDADGSVTTALANVTGEIATALVGREFSTPEDIDQTLIALDGTPSKARLGANALLSVSIAAYRLAAASEGLFLWETIARHAGTKPRLPALFMNVLEGGAHADFGLPFQEYLLIVTGSMGTAFPIAQEAFAKIGERLGAGVTTGDEGGYAPVFKEVHEPFEVLAAITKEFPGTAIAIDAAATQFYKGETYTLVERPHTSDELLQVYRDLAAHYPLKSIEDPFAETRGEDFARLNATLHEHVLVVGDDLTCTNPERIVAAAEAKEITAVIIKPNQIGTVTEAIAATRVAQARGLRTIASHRGGETHDDFIADFAYATGAYGIKAGGLLQGERLAKYDRLRAIEQEARAV